MSVPPKAVSDRSFDINVEEVPWRCEMIELGPSYETKLEEPEDYKYQTPLIDLFGYMGTLAQVKELKLRQHLEATMEKGSDIDSLTYTICGSHLHVLGAHTMKFQVDSLHSPANFVVRDDMVVSDFFSFSTGRKISGGPYDVGNHPISEAENDERILGSLCLKNAFYYKNLNRPSVQDNGVSTENADEPEFWVSSDSEDHSDHQRTGQDACDMLDVDEDSL